MWLARFEVLLDMMSASTAEYNNIEERVSTKTVRPVYRHASSFASSVETRDNRVFAILRSKHSEQYLNERREDEQTLSTVKTSPVYLVGIPPTAKEGLEACIERLKISYCCNEPLARLGLAPS